MRHQGTLQRLFDACTEEKHYWFLEELCLRAGVLWRCEVCNYNNLEDDDVCADCGAPVPDEVEERRDG